MWLKHGKKERERERKSGDGPAENVIWQPCQSEFMARQR